MQAWERGAADAMGADVTRAGSAAPSPGLKNGRELLAGGAGAGAARGAGYLVAVGSRNARFRRKHKSKAPTLMALLLILTLLCVAVTMSILYWRLRARAPPPLCRSPQCLRAAAALALSMDRSADPCSDFYQYVCGNWPREHPRPGAAGAHDWFRDKQARVFAQVRDLLAANATAGPGPGPGPGPEPAPLRQARDMYAACMDVDTLDALGVGPARALLAAAGLPAAPRYVAGGAAAGGGAAGGADWAPVLAALRARLGLDVLVGFDVFTDPRNSSAYRLVLGSPETTDPFPSMHNERTRSRRKRLTRPPDPPGPWGRAAAGDPDELARLKTAYRTFYAELITAFVRDPDPDPTPADPADPADPLDPAPAAANILRAADKYVELYSMFYELEAAAANYTLEEAEAEAEAEVPALTAAELQAATGAAGLSWARYLTALFSGSAVRLELAADRVLVSAPDLQYLRALAAALRGLADDEVELYVWVKTVEVLGSHTTSELRGLYQRFEDTRARAADEGGEGGGGVPPRTLLCSAAVNDLMGMAVAYGLADPDFVNDTKPKVAAMIDEMKDALATLVGRARWMDDATKLASWNKIAAMRALIGFPDWLLLPGRLEAYYEGLEVSRTEHLANMARAVQRRARAALERLRACHEPGWATDPTEVNAYHTFQDNTITVPLVMLQYPFYDLGLESLNYGSLGTILGHEITHGFDNFGRLFDREGNLVPWWSNATVDNFLNLTQCFVEQYSALYVPEADQYVDGKKTLGENIADNGGLRAALLALRRRAPEPRLPGLEHLSRDQLFFLSYGNLWCSSSSAAWLRAALSDEHAPAAPRARAALANSPAFARAWGCPPGARMSPRTRCIVY